MVKRSPDAAGFRHFSDSRILMENRYDQLKYMQLPVFDGDQSSDLLFCLAQHRGSYKKVCTFQEKQANRGSLWPALGPVAVSRATEKLFTDSNILITDSCSLPTLVPPLPLATSPLMYGLFPHPLGKWAPGGRLAEPPRGDGLGSEAHKGKARGGQAGGQLAGTCNQRETEPE